MATEGEISMTVEQQSNGTMDNEGINQNDPNGIESIKGDEVMESLGVTDTTDPDYVENDDVRSSIAEGEF